MQTEIILLFGILVFIALYVLGFSLYDVLKSKKEKEYKVYTVADEYELRESIKRDTKKNKWQPDSVTQLRETTDGYFTVLVIYEVN